MANKLVGPWIKRAPFCTYMKASNHKDPFADQSEIAFYRFENNAEDEYGNYPGTWSGNEIYKSGKFGYGAYFDGNRSAIEISNALLTDEITISFYFNMAQISNDWYSIFHLSKDGENTLIVAAYGGKAQIFIVVNNANSTKYYTPEFDLNKWHHLSITNTGNIYFNGEKIYTTAFNVDLSIINKPILLGADRDEGTSDLGNFAHDITIDHLRFFNKSLIDKYMKCLATER
jgi:hypothetical protein